MAVSLALSVFLPAVAAPDADQTPGGFSNFRKKMRLSQNDAVQGDPADDAAARRRFRRQQRVQEGGDSPGRMPPHMRRGPGMERDFDEPGEGPPGGPPGMGPGEGPPPDMAPGGDGPGMGPGGSPGRGPWSGMGEDRPFKRRFGQDHFGGFKGSYGKRIMQRRSGGGGMFGKRAELDLSSLNLSEAQKQKIRGLRSANGAKARTMRETMMSRGMELRELMFDPNATDAQIRAKRKELGQLQTKFEDMQIGDFLQIRSILTPEQRGKLKDVGGRKRMAGLQPPPPGEDDEGRGPGPEPPPPAE